MALPPWWILNNVKPGAPHKDMGGWTACQFTKEQQRKYGVNANGKVVDQAVHDAAFAPAAKEKSGGHSAHKYKSTRSGCARVGQQGKTHQGVSTGQARQGPRGKAYKARSTMAGPQGRKDVMSVGPQGK